MKTNTKIAIGAVASLFPVALVLGYLALVYVPAWYAPVYVPPAEQQKVRDDFDRYADAFNNAMQRPLPFEFKIAALDINRFIAGIGGFDATLKDKIPSNVTEPAVQLEDNYLKLGAVVEQDGRKVFASLWLRVIPIGDWLVLDDLRVKLGMYRLPRDTLKSRLEKMSAKVGNYWPMIREILDKGRYPNRFRYPNSDYDFRVLDLQARQGILRVMVEPIPRNDRKR